MNVGFYLDKPNASKSSLACVCRMNNRYKASAKISVKTEFWDSARQICREVKQYPESHYINTYLKRFRDAVEAVATQCIAEYVKPTNREFWKRVEMELSGGASRKPMSFTQYMTEYTARRKKRGAISTGKKYHSALQKLLAYEKQHHTTLTFRDINLSFYENFRKFILSQGYTLNYFGCMVCCIKVAYRDARDVDCLHNLRETEKRGFSTPSLTSRSAYLTQSELQSIANVDITVEALQRAFPDTYGNSRVSDLARKVYSLTLVRNKFILGAYTALRVSDFNSLRSVNIQGDFFRVTTHKTGAVVVIPIHPTIKRLIASGFDISTPISEQKINKHIKEVARLAGITQPVEATKLINHRDVIDWWPKCDVITTHTARRSAATNMYKAGIPTISIMRITGHTTEKSFMKYIRITSEENAELMAKNAFFMG